MKNAIFLNKDILLDILYTVFKIYMLILGTVMEGTVSPILDLGPRFYFMKRLEKMSRIYRVW